MTLHSERGTRVVKSALLFTLYSAASVNVIVIFIFRFGLNAGYWSRFVDMVSGTAYRPFVYRALVPALVRFVSWITPQAIKDYVREINQSGRLVAMLGWERAYLYEYFVGVLIFFFLIVGTAFVLRQLVRRFYDFPPSVADISPVIAITVLPVFFRYFNYVYDPATLFLFSFALFCLVKNNIPLFYATFALATVNKETSLLLIGLFALYRYGKMEKQKLFGNLILLFIVFCSIKFAIDYIYRFNPGVFVEVHFDHTLDVLTHPLLLGYFLVFIFVPGGLISIKWKSKPIILRYGLLLMFIPSFVLGIVFGYIDETRIYYECYPFAFLLIVPTTVDLFGGRKDWINT